MPVCAYCGEREVPEGRVACSSACVLRHLPQESQQKRTEKSRASKREEQLDRLARVPKSELVRAGYQTGIMTARRHIARSMLDAARGLQAAVQSSRA